MTASAVELATQRKLTAALIRNDPTTAALIPRVEVTTPSGGQTRTDGTPRQPQTFKLSLLAYDQRPTITVAGVERLIDYHLIALWDAEMEVGDYWVDEEGTRFEVVGFSEGWEYQTKAFVYRHVPKLARP